MNIEGNQRIITELLLSTGREGIEDLIGWLVDDGFFTSPASTKFHGAHEGGLAEHSLGVYQALINLSVNPLTFAEDATAGKKPLPIEPANIVIAGLLHDVCKIGAYIPTPNGKAPYKWNKAQPEGHARLSIELIKKYIELEPLEEIMILFHPGIYGAYEYYEKGTWEYEKKPEYHVRSLEKKPKNPTPEEKKADQDARRNKSLRNAYYHNPICFWFHVADMIAMTQENLQEAKGE